MKALLDIKDEKVVFKCVEANPFTDDKTQLISEIKEAVENLKLVREGKLKARPAQELLDEL